MKCFPPIKAGECSTMMLRLYRSIATVDAKAPLSSLADQEPTWASASTLERSWELKLLADRSSEKQDLLVRMSQFPSSDERSQWQDCAKGSTGFADGAAKGSNRRIYTTTRRANFQACVPEVLVLDFGSHRR
jgi:hypothetical protein